MALTTFIIYADADGTILRAHNGQDGNPPTAPAGHTTLDAGDVLAPIPNPRTHTIDLGPPVALVAKSSGDIISEAQAARKASIEEALGLLDAMRPKMQARGFDLTAHDQRVADLEAEHATYP